MARLPIAGVAAGVVLLSGLACSGGSHNPLSGDAGQLSSTVPDSLSNIRTQDSLALPYQLTIDPATLHADVQPLPDRTGSAQGFVFDLDIANFLRPADLKVATVERLLNGNLEVKIRHRHPFPAVVPTSPAVGTNRADLSYTGRLLVLADETNDTYFSGAVTVDPNFLANADGFAEVGNLLATTGLTNNAFPYKLLVDEALNNRVGVSNLGIMTGSYNPVAGGWQRSNLGPSNTGWTGYDYLHGGQVTDVTLQISASRLSGSVSVPLAVLIKYVDPKGVGTGSKRIPPATPDVTFFAYRLPHSALDVSRVSGLNTALINDTAGSMATIQFDVRDWDAQAGVASDTDLSDESNVGLVLPSTTGFPTVELSIPAFAGAPINILPSAGATGLPGDEIPYLANITNSLGTAAPGDIYGLLRATDKEDGVLAATNIHYGVDAISLVADPARALRVRTYQAVKFIVQGNGVPPTIISVTPPGGTLGRGGDLVSFSAVASNSPTSWSWDFGGGTSPNISALGTPLVTLGTRGNYTGSVDATNAFGTSPSFPFNYTILPFGWAKHWGGISSDAVTALETDGSGNAFVAGTFSGSVDFDPNAGVVTRTATGANDAFVAKFDGNGDLLWVATYGDSADVTVTKLVRDSTNRIYAVGTASATFDADPGTGTDSVFLTSPGAYATLLDTDGTYIRSFGWDAMGVSGSTAITAALQPSTDGLIVGGQFINALGFDLDPTFGTQTALSLSPSYSHAWVVSLTSTGSFSWGRHYGNILGSTRLRGIAFDGSGSLRIVGSWYETTDFDPGAGTQNRTAAGSLDDAYLLSFTSAGDYSDVRTWGNNNEDQAQSIVQDDGFSVVVGGWTRGSTGVDIDPGAGVTTVTMSDTTIGGVYLSKFNTSAIIPSFSMAAARGWDSMGTIRVDANPSNGRILTALRVTASADADPGAGTIAVAGTDDPLFVVTDNAGDYLYHYFVNEAGSALPLAQYGSSGEIFAASYFSGGPTDFDPTAFVDDHTSNGSNDCLLMRLTSQLSWD